MPCTADERMQIAGWLARSRPLPDLRMILWRGLRRVGAVQGVKLRSELEIARYVRDAVDVRLDEDAQRSALEPLLRDMMRDLGELGHDELSRLLSTGRGMKKPVDILALRLKWRKDAIQWDRQQEKRLRAALGELRGSP